MPSSPAITEMTQSSTINQNPPPNIKSSEVEDSLGSSIRGGLAMKGGL
jgi:hypothetical protein